MKTRRRRNLTVMLFLLKLLSACLPLDYLDRKSIYLEAHLCELEARFAVYFKEPETISST